MTDDDYLRLLNKTIDTAFEDLAEELDQIAARHDFTSIDMRELLILASADFRAYYEDWMQEIWEKRYVEGNA